MFAPNRMGLGMRPPQAQYSAPPAQPAPAPGMTTLFVGSISSGITDDFLTTLFSVRLAANAAKGAIANKLAGLRPTAVV
jgi:hypothetical protein